MKRTPAMTTKGDAMDLAIASWRREPEDRRTLAGVRAELLARQVRAIQSGTEGGGELERAVANLLDRIREDNADANTSVVDAVAEAARRLAGSTVDADDAAVGDLVERLDAYASGLTDLEFEQARMPGESARDEPPLLTVRHDGVKVKPGTFETTFDAGKKQGSELPILVAAWEAVGDHLRGQLESLRANADKNADPEQHRLSGALQGTLETIERLNRSLQDYARRVGE